LVTAELLGRLIAEAEAPHSPLVACRFGAEAGAIGPPALFPRRCFPELAALSGDVGARAVLERHAAELVTLEFPGGELDVDAEADVARLAALFP
jgi:molybdenum cofactor cytidylyltransferase